MAATVNNCHIRVHEQNKLPGRVTTGLKVALLYIMVNIAIYMQLCNTYCEIRTALSVLELIGSNLLARRAAVGSVGALASRSISGPIL